MADAKFEVADEKCDLRLQLRQKREESREKPEVTPKKLDPPPLGHFSGLTLVGVRSFFGPPGKV